MAQNIKLFAGRLKKLQFTWREGVSSSSPPLDISGATCIIQSTNLGSGVSITILDAVNGLCELTFAPSCSQGKRGIYHIMIALTFTSDPGYSPDPVQVEVAVYP